MKSDNEYYSVVAAYEHDGRLWYYRLADIDPINHDIIEANYNTDDNGYLYEPVSFYSNENKDLFKTIIKKWMYDEVNDRYQRFLNCDIKGKVYEISFLEDDIEYKEYDENYVREVLHNGFCLDDSVNNDFLLVVGKKNDNLVLLRCEKRKFESKRISKDGFDGTYLYVDKSERDILHSITSLDIYKIKSSEIVSINNLLEHNFAKSAGITARYFFEKLKLPEKSGTFLVRKIDDYVINFFSKYFKDVKDVFEITKKERNKFISIIQSLKDSNSTFDELKEQTGYSSEEIYALLSKVGQNVVDSLRSDDEMGKILKDFLLYDDKYYEECLNEVKNNWQESDEFIKEKEEREVKLLNLLSDIDTEKQSLKVIQSELLECQNKKEVTQKQYDELTLKLDSSKKEMAASLSNYKNDILQVIKDSALIDLSKQSSPDNTRRGGYLHKKNKEIESLDKFYVVKTENYDDFKDYLIDNFKLFYSSKKAVELAASTISSVVNSKAIIVDESIGESYANCISMIVDNREIDRYIVHNSNVDVNRLCYSLSKNPNTIIYIDGVLNSFNETLLKTLVKTFPTKQFIFGVDTENIFILSKGIWKFATYLDVCSQYEGESNENYLISNYDIKNIKKEISDQTPSFKDRKLNDIKLLSDFQKFNLSNILSIYSSMISCNDAPVFYINQIILNSSKSNDEILEKLGEHYSEKIIEESILSNEMG